MNSGYPRPTVKYILNNECLLLNPTVTNGECCLESFIETYIVKDKVHKMSHVISSRRGVQYSHITEQITLQELIDHCS